MYVTPLPVFPNIELNVQTYTHSLTDLSVSGVEARLGNRDYNWKIKTKVEKYSPPPGSQPRSPGTESHCATNEQCWNLDLYFLHTCFEIDPRLINFRSSFDTLTQSVQELANRLDRVENFAKEFSNKKPDAEWEMEDFFFRIICWTIARGPLGTPSRPHFRKKIKFYYQLQFQKI